MNLKLAILDSLSDDYETIVQIHNYLSFLNLNVNMNDILSLLKSMIEEELIFINEEISDKDFIWYGLSEKGRSIWERGNIVCM